LQVSVFDRMEIMDSRRTNDGFLATKGRISKTGIYEYRKGEVGAAGNPNDIVKIYRSEDAVFSDESMATFAHRPITLNHPPVMVDAQNWKRYAVGQAGSKVRRDGDFVEVDMLLLDGSAISAVEGGAMISPGYVAEVDMTPGQTPEGEHFDGQMVGPFRGNHIAVLTGRGRGGPECRIGDAWPMEDHRTPPKKDTRMSTLMLDGLKVDLSDAEAVTAAVKKLTDAKDAADARAEKAEKALTDAEAKAATDLKDANDRADKAEASEATAKKELADSKVTPEQLRDAAKAYAKVVDGAAKIAADFKIEDSMTEAEIKKGAVLVALGDAYKDKSDAFFDAAFEIEVGKVKVADKAPIDPFRDAMAHRDVVDFADAAAKAKTAREKMIAEMTAPRGEAK